jgi:FF domain
VLWQLQAMQEEQEDVEMAPAGEDDEAGGDDMDDRSSDAGEPLDGGQDGEEVPDEQAVEAFTVSVMIHLTSITLTLPILLTKYQELLSESDISPFATWEMELPKIIGDARYKGKEWPFIKCFFRLTWQVLI